ncbi:hypothetical protein G9464_01830 [Halostella sp. JP-L12]|uniref:hypothetical protein n=1 Tax=Halostella TaxID=1843185 RepID=UPI000EF7F571|nr:MULTISPECIES: hypothetical protein [Halostella]NHN46340.1 hypothetical protein [Halostella sp. JP-L12]
MAPSSEGDPRVLLVMNAVLSGSLSYLVVRGYAFAGGAPFAWRNVLLLTLVLMALTFLVIR